MRHQTCFVELLRADGLVLPDPNAHVGKRKASDEGEDTDEGDETQLKALMVCPLSLPSPIRVDIDCLQEKVHKIQSKLEKKAAKSKPAKKVKMEDSEPVLAGEVIDLDTLY